MMRVRFSMRSLIGCSVSAAFIFFLGCQSTPVRPVASGTARASQLRAGKLAEMDGAILTAIQEKKCPGAVLWVEHGEAVYKKSYGNRAVVPTAEPMTDDTIFDAASLTKALATAPCVMLLVESGALQLDAPAAQYLREFTSEGREKITIRHLMTHTSGLRPGIETRSDWSGRKAGVAKACGELPQTNPGEVFRYSDINYILLGAIVERVSGKPLRHFAKDRLYSPLKMADTGFLPTANNGRIAPTEVSGGIPLRGVVHDPTARKMGGVAGHAGLFTTASDMARFCRMLLGEGELEGQRVFKPETVRLMTSVQALAGGVRRGLGWDIDSGYSGPRGKFFPVGSYGHTGWTGTSVWIDPFSQTFVILMSNRNHPDERGNVLPLRGQIGTLAAEAVQDYNLVYVPGALDGGRRTNTAITAMPVQSTVLNGIDVLRRRNFDLVKGLKLGLVTNQTGEDRERNSTIDLLRNAAGVQLQVLFSPEHGIRGQLDEKVSDSTDEKTGLPVFSLYGESRKPKLEQLRGLDALVYDIQDVGCRFYTYTATMAICMEACAEAGIRFIVLDRANPINGVAVEGPVLREKPTFVGYHNVPLRYGMTIGELARMFNGERNLQANLTVVPVENWSRNQWLDETGLPWTNPSPNMRALKQATLYPGVGLLESALAVGRGTDTPFEVVGAPYADDIQLARELNKAGLSGVRFVPVRFTPSASTFKGMPCRGVYISLTDRDVLNAVDVGIVLAKTFNRLYPEHFQLDKTKHLLLDAPTLAAIGRDASLDDIHALWSDGLKRFARVRSKYLLY